MAISEMIGTTETGPKCPDSSALGPMSKAARYTGVIGYTKISSYHRTTRSLWRTFVPGNFHLFLETFIPGTFSSQELSFPGYLHVQFYNSSLGLGFKHSPSLIIMMCL